MRILVTGGAGYVGSHVVLEALAHGHTVHVLDNFENSSALVLDRVRELAGGSFDATKADICDAAAVAGVVERFRPDGVIHLAALKAVGESVSRPLCYYRNNVAGTIGLLDALAASDCRSFVFSSSATVYGEPEYVPIDEVHPRRGTSPYGRSKLHIENILEDLATSDPSWSIALLRYFNPVGAHASGRIGEDPTGIPNNLMPYLAQVAVGRRPALQLFGNDYDTPDGSGVRDYVHVVDLAEAHLAAVAWAAAPGRGCDAFNLGTGKGSSVLDLVRAFEAASSRSIPVQVAPRRPGDVATCYANPQKALEHLGWQARRGLDDMCATSWAWQSQNPLGYWSR
jgi:UDP-glucose 4-epimerase